MYLKKASGIKTLSCDEGSTRLRPEWTLNELGELGGKEFLLKNQYNSEICSCFLLLFPWCSSTFHQTNVENAQNGFEDNLFFSRIQSLHRLQEVDNMTKKIDPGKSSNCISEVSCSLSSWSLLFKFVTNFFKPWEILTHEWELSLFTDSILISTPYLPCTQQVGTSGSGPILVFPRIQPFGSDESSSLGKVYSRQATKSVNCENSSVSFVMEYCPNSTTFRNPASVQNLLTLSCCDNFSIRSLYLCHRNSYVQDHNSKQYVCLDHLARMRNSTVLPKRVSLFYHGRSHVLPTFLRLLREDWADVQK